MASQQLVDWVLDTLTANWISTNAPTPTFIDRDNADGDTFNGRRVAFDLSQGNAVSVAGGDLTRSAMGSEFDYRIQHPVNIRVEAAHEDKWGNVADSQAFEALWREAMRCLNAERKWPFRNSPGQRHYHSLFIENEGDQSSANKDYYRYDFDAMFHGYEDMPADTA